MAAAAPERYFDGSGGTSTYQGHGSDIFVLLVACFTTLIFIVSAPQKLNGECWLTRGTPYRW
jgi:hypothetical protein